MKGGGRLARCEGQWINHASEWTTSHIICCTGNALYSKRDHILEIV